MCVRSYRFIYAPDERSSNILPPAVLSERLVVRENRFCTKGCRVSVRQPLEVNFMPLRNFLALVVVILLVPVLAYSAQQGSHITVSGTITDPSRAVVSGATVSLRVLRCKCSDCNPQEACDCCPDQLSVNSDAVGRYSVTVPHGTYRLNVKAENREAHVDVDLNGGETMHEDVQLR